MSRATSVGKARHGQGVGANPLQGCPEHSTLNCSALAGYCPGPAIGLPDPGTICVKMPGQELFPLGGVDTAPLVEEGEILATRTCLAVVGINVAFGAARSVPALEQSIEVSPSLTWVHVCGHI